VLQASGWPDARLRHRNGVERFDRMQSYVRQASFSVPDHYKKFSRRGAASSGMRTSELLGLPDPPQFASRLTPVTNLEVAAGFGCFRPRQAPPLREGARTQEHTCSRFSRHYESPQKLSLVTGV